MLTKLFSSPVRVKILKFLAMNDGGSFSAHDIAKKTGSVIRSVNKEAVKLIGAGAVIEEIKPETINKKTVKVKHYRINKDFILFNEIKSLFLKSQVLDLDNFKSKLVKLGKINYVVLTGKFVGDNSAAVDLLLVGDAEHKKSEKIVAEFEKTIGFEINWTLMPLEEYDYRQKIGDMFIYNLLGRKTIEVYSRFV
ncbi:MAG: hypothetical protein WC323_00370 [Patescibacteria group bacterium]|jgi:hypothetical protein